jgi:hypothetical protein
MILLLDRSIARRFLRDYSLIGFKTVKVMMDLILIEISMVDKDFGPLKIALH